MQITNVADVPEAPGAARVSFQDGTSMTVPRSSLPPNLQLPPSGATAQSSVATGGPQMSIGPTTPDEFANKWGAQPVKNEAQDVQNSQPQAIPNAQQWAPEQPREVQLSPSEMAARRLESPYQKVAGTRAFNPSAEAAARRPVPVSQSIQSSGARAYDPEMLQDAQAKEVKGLEARIEGDMLAAQSKAMADRMAYEETSRAYEQQRAQQQAAEQEFRAKQAELDNEAQEVANRKIDPDRVFKNMSVFQTIGLAIAAGLKGYATQGKDNSIVEGLMQRMNADIRAQESDLQNSKGKVDNALGRLSQRYGSLEAGKAALRDQQLSVLRAKAAATGSEIGTAIAKSNSDGLLAQLDAEQTKLREQRWAESQGQITTATQSAMMAPRARTSGGFAMKSAEKYAADVGRASTLRGTTATTEGKQLENIEKRGELTGEIPGKRGDKVEDQVSQYGQRRTAVEAAKTSLDRFIAENGIQRGKDGNLIPPDDIAGFGRVGQHAPNAITSQQGINNRAAIEQIVFNKVQASFGAANDQQVKMISDIVIGNGTATHITSQLNQLDHTLAADAKNIDASYSPNVLQQYKRNKGAAISEGATKDTSWQPISFDEGPK